jgi:hypothetical protein
VPGLDAVRDGGRIFHGDDILTHYQKWEWESGREWELLKYVMLPSYGAAYGLHEVNSHHNLTGRRNVEFRARLLTDPRSRELLSMADVRLLVALKPHRRDTRTPVAGDFDTFVARETRGPVFFETGGGTATLTSDTPVDRRMAATGPGRLVVSQQFYPGWSFWVDGRRRPLVVGEDIFPAVDVPAGEHAVRFVYRPWPALVGAGLTGMTLVFLTGAMLWRRRRARS